MKKINIQIVLTQAEVPAIFPKDELWYSITENIIYYIDESGIRSTWVMFYQFPSSVKEIEEDRSGSSEKVFYTETVADKKFVLDLVGVCLAPKEYIAKP